MTIYYYGHGMRQTFDGIGLNAVLLESQVANLGYITIADRMKGACHKNLLFGTECLLASKNVLAGEMWLFTVI